MLYLSNDKRPKEQRCFFPIKTQLKMALAQEKDGHTYENRIQHFFLTAILLFLFAIDMPLKYEASKTKYTLENNTLLYRNYSQTKLLSKNISENVNNLKLNIKTISDKDVQYLSLYISIILIIITVIYYYAPKMIMNLNKNGIYEIENKSRKTLNLSDLIKNNNENIRIEDNNKNKGKNKIIRNINNIRNYNIIIIFLIIMNIFIQILPYNKKDLIKFNFSNITLRINGTGNKNSTYYPNYVYINGNKQDPVKSIYDFNQIDNYVELIWNNTIDNCQNIFYNCSDILEIDLSNFDTSECKSMNSMFNDCSSLTSLNLSNFDTCKVADMQYMFYGCSSLTSLNLSNFNTSKVTNMYRMFYDCANLEYINLQNFDETSLSKGAVNYIDMLTNVPENVVICINKDNNNNTIYPEIIKLACYNIDCTNNWKSGQKKIIKRTTVCIDNCNNTEKFKYEYNGKCYENCSNGYILDDNNNKTDKCKCELEKCLTCPQVALNKNLCTLCNNKYYRKENDPSNIGEYFNCYKKIEGYYLDKDESLFKKCYNTCKTCEIKGDNITHNCLKCNENYSIEIKINNYSNCYCQYYYYDNETNYHCTDNYSCPDEYPILLQNKSECIKDYNNNYETSEIINKEYTTENNIEEYTTDNIIKVITRTYNR